MQLRPLFHLHIFWLRLTNWILWCKMTDLILSIEILVPLVGHWVVRVPHICAVLPVDHSAWKCDKCCNVQTGAAAPHPPGCSLTPAGWLGECLYSDILVQLTSACNCQIIMQSKTVVQLMKTNMCHIFLINNPLPLDSWLPRLAGRILLLAPCILFPNKCF